nr:hypothetical protein I302_01168 [Kwoniella bestiolae CBS 10118]OCF29657.1 hypothetical protein I302_01168 [Kwoniella bestiolae CBS 10118]
MHAVRYQHPPAQRQVMRVLLMPAVYSIVSFFSYRYYREYEYYILAETAYEAITLSAFLMLLMELVSMGTTDQQIKTALAEKDKKKFPFPFNFWRFRASKPYFWHALSFSVMQYVILRPLISIVGIICLYYGVLCPDEYSVHYAEAYLDAVDFVSISVALYGLIIFYVLCKDELKGRKPLNKFLAIKLIVFFTFYQSFLFSILQTYNVIKGTALWTATNVSDGLSALCTCVEMVFFSIYMGWAYNWTDYTDPLKNPHQRHTSIKTYFQAIWDTINLSDFGLEIYLACKFLVDYIRGKPGTHSSSTKLQRTFMPDTIEGDENRPQELSNLKTGYANGSTAPTQHQQTDFTSSSPLQHDRRTSSGNMTPTLRSTKSYQRLQEGDHNHAQSQYTPAQHQQNHINSSNFYQAEQPPQETFPSAYPTGAQPAQGNAAWPEARPAQAYPYSAGDARTTEMGQRQRGWEGLSQSQRSRGYNYGDSYGEEGIPGNPKLY